MLLEIRGHHLPGRHWQLDGEPCDNVHVGIQVGREPSGLVRGDSERAAWTAAVEVIERDGNLDYRGRAVQGRRGARFVYLTWGNVSEDGSFTMFRRAKLMLVALEPFVTRTPAPGRIVATVDLTDECGGPRCARLSPPALTLVAGHEAKSPPASERAR